MRATWYLGLVVVGLAALGFRGARSHAQSPAPAWPALEKEQQVHRGIGENEKDAILVAEDKACKALKEYFAAHHAQLGVRPADELLRPERLRSLGVIRPEGKTVKRRDGNLEVHVRVELTPRFAEEAQRVVKEHRAQARHLLLARLLAGAVVLLLVVAGYLRLEDATRGYYTRLLRLAAVSVLVATGLGLLMTL